MVTFRKSKKIGPFRITLSPRGVSTSAGVPGFRVSANSRGEVRRTVSIPGTGIYDTRKVNPRRPHERGAHPAAPTGQGRDNQPAASRHAHPVARAQVPSQVEEIAGGLVRGLEPDQQRVLYEDYRADRAAGLITFRRWLEARGGWTPETLDMLMPAVQAYLDRWMLL